MTLDDSVAEKFQQYEGQPLADYLPVALPCYLLQVDAVVVERKKLMPVEEFLLRAVVAGLSNEGDAGALLGLSKRHADQLVSQLDDQEYLSVGDDGTVRIRPKGKEVLARECEKRPAERSISVIWDPVKESPLTSWFDLLSPSDVRGEARLVVVPRSLRLPSPDAIPIDEIQATKRRGLSDREATDEIVRFLEIQRRTLRYRRGTVLAYSTGDSRVPLVKVAIEGMIDEAYSHAFAQHSLAEQIGIDRQFARRHGIATVRQRIEMLGGQSGIQGNYGELLKRRSVLRFGLEALERRQEDEKSAELASRVQERRDGLAEVERALATWPIRKLMPFEVPQLMESALRTAKHQIVVTSTMPIETRFSRSLISQLETALRRGVQISMLFAGRPQLGADNRQRKQWNPVRELNGLTEMYRNLRVGFLKDTARTVFEIAVDDSSLVVANEPPLGVRPRELLLRSFSGYLLLSQPQIRAYLASQMAGDKIAEVEQLRVQRDSGVRSQSSSAAHPHRHGRKGMARR